MKYFLILWMLSALDVECAIKYVDNVHLKQNEYLIPKPHSQSDEKKDVSVTFRKSTIHTLSGKLVKYFSSDQQITLSGCQIEKIDTFSDPLTKIIHLNLSSNQISRLQAHQFKWAPRLYVLDLSHNVINELAKSAFDGLYKLLKLDLSENRLKTLIERVFAELKNLKQLNLDGNSLTALQSSYFFGLGQLTTLNLQRNSLARIENSTFHSADRLTTIFMSDNQISAVDKQAFHKLNELKNLRLNRNQLTSFGAIVLPQDIENLSLDSNYLKSVNFDDFLNLKHLSLARNKEIQWRTTRLEKLTELTHLCVSDTNITGSLIVDGFLSHFKNLEILDVSKNPLNFLDLSSVPNMKNLTHLSLNDCKLSNIQNYETINEKFPKLEELTIINNSLPCEFMQKLTSILKPGAVIVKDLCPLISINTVNDAFTSDYQSLTETSTTKDNGELTAKSNIIRENNITDMSLPNIAVASIHDKNLLRDLKFWTVLLIIAVSALIGVLICYFHKCKETQVTTESGLA